MRSADRADWLIPVGLVALSGIPIGAGLFRVAQLAGGPAMMPDLPRFETTPVPDVLHWLSCAIFCVLGALQFSPGLRRRHPDWHRDAGPILVPVGLAAALAGAWMTGVLPTGVVLTGRLHGSWVNVLWVNVPWVNGSWVNGPWVIGLRVLTSSAMALSLCLGLAALRGRAIAPQRTWALRGCALGLGAGAQLVTHLPWHLLPALHGEIARTFLMAVGWTLTWAVARLLTFPTRAGEVNINTASQLRHDVQIAMATAIASGRPRRQPSQSTRICTTSASGTAVR